MAGLPSAIPSRPLKENKTRPIPNYKKKARHGREDENEDTVDDEDGKEVPKARAFVKPQRQEPFKTAGQQLAINSLKKNPHTSSHST